MDKERNIEVQLLYKGKVHCLPFDSRQLPDHYRSYALGWFREEKWDNETQIKKWTEDYTFFINSIQIEHRQILVDKGIEYAKLLLKFHRENEVLSNSLVRSWERRITIAENLLIRSEFSKSPNYSSYKPTNETHRLQTKCTPEELDNLRRMLMCTNRISSISQENFMYWFLEQPLIDEPIQIEWILTRQNSRKLAFQFLSTICKKIEVKGELRNNVSGFKRCLYIGKNALDSNDNRKIDKAFQDEIKAIATSLN